VLSTASSIQKHETYLYPIITTHCQSLRMATIARQHDINNRINAKLPPLATYCEASYPAVFFNTLISLRQQRKGVKRSQKTRHVRTRRHGKQGRELQGKSIKVRQPAQAHKRRRKRMRARAGACRCESSGRIMQGQAGLDHREGNERDGKLYAKVRQGSRANQGCSAEATRMMDGRQARQCTRGLSMLRK
jgi:hypothetical protein